ncbi:unnamed protein product [Calypogeia fissa]
MENSGSASEGIRTGMSRRYGMPFASSLLPAPISAILEFSGLMRGSRSHYSELESLGQNTSGAMSQNGENERNGDSGAEVSIRIIGVGEQDGNRGGAGSPSSHSRNITENSASTSQVPLSSLLPTMRLPSVDGGDRGTMNISPRSPNTEERGEVSDNGGGANGRETGGQRYDFQQLARWIEQALPFTILLLMVFIRQHLHGFFVTFWISAVMIKANDLLRKQTALKGERKTLILVGIGFAMVTHIIGVYWWYSKDSLWRPLVILPPQEIPRFWQAIFIIVVNDTMVRQSAMVLKIGLLIYYKNSRGRNYRRQAQLLTLVEYILLLYRALIPGPVWYRFFLNKEYGNLFSSLTTGLYLTFKLTSTYEKVKTFIAALRALSRREVQYGAYATTEEVSAAGDMCAICQEKMHAPISLRCKHIFCEDCVSEWFERERTCPLCRAVVKSAGLRSFGDGSTSLFIQIF